MINVENGTELINAVENASNGDVISMKKGVYEVTKTLNLKSGITILGNGSTVKGSKKIKVSGSGIVEIDLKKIGIENLGEFGGGPYEDFWKGAVSIPKPHLTELGPGLELFYQDKLMPVSRYPESGFLKITKALGETDKVFRGERNGSREGIFTCNDDKIKEFEDFKELLLVGYWSADWATQRHTVKSIDKETGIIEVNKPWHTFGYRDGKCYTEEVGGKFYVLNAKKAIKHPGQWAINRKKGKLYVYLYEGQDEISLSVADDIFYANAVENVKISDLKLSECRKSGICVENSSNIYVENISVENTGAWGILGENVMAMTVKNCFVTNVGGGGIALSGGDRGELISSENKIMNCEVTEIARWHKTYMAAIEIGGVGGLVSENKIYDVPHFGILYSGNDHIIEKNDIGNACYESNDAGAIYSGRDYTYRGMIVRNNYLHDMLGFGGHGCIGLYFDDAVSSAEVYGNIFSNMPYIGLLLGGGRDFSIHDNIFYNCKMAIMYDKRASRWKDLPNTIMKVLDFVDYKSEKWKKAYPKLYSFMEEDPLMPMGNSFKNNRIIGGDGFCLEDKLLEEITEISGNVFVNPNKTEPHEINHFNWYYINC